MLDKHLQQQLEKSHLTKNNPPQNKEQWQAFIATVNRAYVDHENTLSLFKELQDDPSDEQSLKKELSKKAQQCINTTKELQLRSAFMENLSHQIRTSIHGILGSLEIVKDSSNLDNKAYTFINAALLSGESLLDIGNNILDFTKIIARELELEEKSFNIKELLAEINSVIHSISKEKNLILMTELDEDLPERIKGDSTRLRQILMNLAKNAIRFTDQGSITLQVHRIKQHEDDVILRFEITDTGIGIATSTVEKILTAFALFTADGSPTADGSSTASSSTMDEFTEIGLGLTISKELVHLMKGSINIESIEGKGTHLWVDIPFKAVDTQDINKMNTNSDLSSLKVLVIEQQSTSHSILEHYFSTWGIEFTFVDNCSEAIEKLYQARDSLSEFNVVMIDYYMPGAECFELSEIMNTHQNISKVTLSSYNLAAQEREIANIKICLVKPIREAQLKETLFDCLKPNDITDNSIAISDDSLADILLAEDNSVNALLAITMMEQIGLTVKHVENGQQAVNEIINHHYKLVLMDVHMPVMDGYKATQNIRQWEQATQADAVPIIALTADALASDKEKCLNAGMSGYLSKPIKQKVLQEVISKWVEKTAETTE